MTDGGGCMFRATFDDAESWHPEAAKGTMYSKTSWCMIKRYVLNALKSNSLSECCQFNRQLLLKRRFSEPPLVAPKNAGAHGLLLLAAHWCWLPTGRHKPLEQNIASGASVEEGDNRYLSGQTIICSQNEGSSERSAIEWIHHTAVKLRLFNYWYGLRHFSKPPAASTQGWSCYCSVMSVGDHWLNLTSYK